MHLFQYKHSFPCSNGEKSGRVLRRVEGDKGYIKAFVLCLQHANKSDGVMRSMLMKWETKVLLNCSFVIKNKADTSPAWVSITGKAVREPPPMAGDILAARSKRLCLSPMINSRWPRPMGTNESTALIPVCIGSRTETRGIIPGALIPTRKRSLVLMAPLPSIALPKASTTRPNISLPTGTSTIAPVRFTISPCLISLSLPKTTTPTLSGSKFKAIPFKPEENSTISSA
uniref:Uncharacterized protein n=1 Tax=Glossina pallidipes TaxID=7398 RepID=A0A1A9ZX38_GLOPL